MSLVVSIIHKSFLQLIFYEDFSKLKHTSQVNIQLFTKKNRYNYLVREGFKKNKKMVGLIHRGWLAGVSLGPKSNPEKNEFEKNVSNALPGWLESDELG